MALPILPVLLLLHQDPGQGMTKVNPAHLPDAVVARHVAAYNAHDLQGMLGTLSLDIQLWMFPDKLQVKGKADVANAMRQSFASGPDQKMEVTERMVAGTKVIDHLWIKGRGDGRVIRGVQIYEVKDGLITGIWFMLD
jgi:hypothetical protein